MKIIVLLVIRKKSIFYLINFLYRFFAAPKPNPPAEKMIIGATKRGYSKLESLMKRNGGDYMMGNELTLIDFYAMVFVILPHESGAVTLDGHADLNEWYERMKQIPEAEKHRSKFVKTLKLGMFFVKWILPVLNCATCKCCCPKKKA